MNKRKVKFEIDWIDAGREPREPFNPEYPNGIDLDVSDGGSPTCHVILPYPAIRCGVYAVRCTSCEAKVACTTAGRLDDPRSITIPCNKKYQD